jgi:hypothetical protein
VPKVERIGDDSKDDDGFEFEGTTRPSTIEQGQPEDGAGKIDADETSPVEERPLLVGDRKAHEQESGRYPGGQSHPYLRLPPRHQM